jgi:hypothetical protein
MKSVYHHQYKIYKKQIDNFIENFKISGIQFGKASRNTIKLFELNNELLNIKAFKIPNIFNQVIYSFFRKSKAQRSFEYANKLIALGINTPKPIAYFESKPSFLFKSSFYVSKHFECDLTYRELSRDLNYPDHDNILRAFTRFTYKLHELGVNFLDHSPGNTLIKKVGKDYVFYLVDLNRMEFKPMDFKTRINNFSRLTTQQSMIKVMSDEYAKVSGEDYNKVFKLMRQFTQEFQDKFQRKKRLKKTLKFWK